MKFLPYPNTAAAYRFAILFIILLVVSAGAVYQYITLHLEHEEARRTLWDTSERLTAATNTIATLETRLSNARNENAELSNELREEKERVGELVDQVEDITGAVSTIEKRQKLDEELLKKYSKTYFLNEHYRPSDLEPIPQEYRYPEHEFEEFHEKALPFLEDMIEDAKDDGVDLLVASGFRSFDSQRSIHDRYTQTYGSGANQFSAVQGYSEHQLGTTVDFTTPELSGSLRGFDQTEVYEWLQGNAYKYGFVLSYPEGNTYYQFEPWHWRFVGEELADDLHDRDIDFYDMPQREIDEYLVDIFED